MHSPAGDPDVIINVILVGDRAVGKSNLASKYTINKFDLETPATQGVGFREKRDTIDGKHVRARIWDASGQERSRSVVYRHFENVAGALLVYDITKQSSFENVKQWLKDLQLHGEPGIKVTLVGNKADLRYLRAVSTEEAKDFAERNRMKFIETSALDGSNVNEAFVTVLKDAYEHITKKNQAVTKHRSRCVSLPAAPPEDEEPNDSSDKVLKDDKAPARPPKKRPVSVPCIHGGPPDDIQKATIDKLPQQIKDYELKINQMGAVIKATQRKLSQRDAQCKDHELKLEQMRSVLSDTQRKLSQRDTHCLALKEEVFEMKQKNEALQTKNSSLENEVKERKESEASLKSDLEEIRSAPAALQTELTEFKEQAKALQTPAQPSNETMLDLKQRIEALQTKNSSLECELKESRDTEASLKSDLEESKSAAAALQTELADSKEQAKTLQAPEQPSDDEVVELKQKIEALQTKKNSLESEHKDCKDAEATLKSNMEESKRTVAALKTELAESKEQAKALQALAQHIRPSRPSLPRSPTDVASLVQVAVAPEEAYILQKNHVYLITNLPCETLKDYLFQEEILNLDDLDELDVLKTRRKQNERMIKLIFRHPSGYKTLMDFLENPENDTVWLAEQLGATDLSVFGQAKL